MAAYLLAKQKVRVQFPYTPLGPEGWEPSTRVLRVRFPHGPLTSPRRRLRLNVRRGSSGHPGRGQLGLSRNQAHANIKPPEGAWYYSGLLLVPSADGRD